MRQSLVQNYGVMGEHAMNQVASELIASHVKPCSYKVCNTPYHDIIRSARMYAPVHTCAYLKSIWVRLLGEFCFKGFVKTMQQMCSHYKATEGPTWAS